MKLTLHVRLAALAASLGVAVSLASCSSPGTKHPSSTTSNESDGTKTSSGISPRPLTHEEAQARFKQVAHVTYALWFGLNEHGEDFEGRTTIHFEVKPKAKDHGKDLFLDFHGGQIRSIIMNGTTLANPEERYDGNRIHFSLNELQSGTNRVEIAFVHKFSTNGHGLFRFKDSEDGSVYIYSDDEPNFAHTIFPCFDQPDLKASYETTVAAPPSWQVITNTLERDTSMVDGRKVWVYPPTPLLSTYLFALFAGGYVSWKGDADGIPLRLFARKAMKQYVDAQDWLAITKKGLDFYATEFGYPYPYSKYDQILAPEYDQGAMENAGAVTFSENLIFRTRVPQRKKMHRANVILHEMAHMWFGDLVTMKWWNGLWLNESFADFMATWAVDKTTSFKGAWQDFFADDKNWAYWQDQLVTTHPIEVPVPDTDHAYSNFDGITYGKGAAVLQQLKYYLGDDDFREGLQRYFLRFALRNSTLGEFMKMLTEASEKNLTSWQEAWLTTPGVNTLQADWTCSAEDGGVSKIFKMNLIQGNAQESKTLRPHRTKLALFYRKGGSFVEKDILPVTYVNAETPVPDATGKPCPEFVYPNYADPDYVKVLLDPVSLKSMSQNIRHIQNPLVRQMFWASYWSLVTDGMLSARTYLETALSNLAFEHDLFVLPQVINTLAFSQHSTYTAMKFVAPGERDALWSKYEALAMKQLQISPIGSDLQLVWFNAFLDSIHTQAGIDFATKLLKKRSYSGIRIDQEVRWSLLSALARNGAPNVKSMIEVEYKADPTLFGRQSRLRALVQIPSSENKLAWIDKIIAAGKAGGSTPELSSADLRTVMFSMNVLGQEKFTEEWMPKYFDFLEQAAHAPDEEYAGSYSRGLFPTICSQDVIDRTSAALKNDFPASPEKALKTRLQEEQRCLKARAQSLTTSSTGQ